MLTRRKDFLKHFLNRDAVKNIKFVQNGVCYNNVVVRRKENR